MNYPLLQELYEKLLALGNFSGPMLFKETDGSFLFALYIDFDEELEQRAIYLLPDEEALLIRLLSIDYLSESVEMEDVSFVACLDHSISIIFEEASDYNREQIEAYEKAGFDVNKHGVVPVSVYTPRFVLTEMELTGEMETILLAPVALLAMDDTLEQFQPIVEFGCEKGKVPVFRINSFSGTLHFRGEFDDYPNLAEYEEVDRLVSDRPARLELSELNTQRIIKELRGYKSREVEVLIDPFGFVIEGDYQKPLRLQLIVDDVLSEVSFDMNNETYLAFLQQEFLMFCQREKIHPRVILTAGPFESLVKNSLDPIAKKLKTSILSTQDLNLF